jgi:ADP-ribosyl cyclase
VLVTVSFVSPASKLNVISITFKFELVHPRQTVVATSTSVNTLTCNLHNYLIRHWQVMLFFKSVAVTALCSAVITVVTSSRIPIEFALDTRDNGTNVEVASVEAMTDVLKSKMRNTEGKVLFWCLGNTVGHASHDRAQMYAKKHHLYTIFDYVNAERFFAEVPESAYNTWWENLSRAFARASVGKVYVLLEPGNTKNLLEWHCNSVWNNIEWPELENNKEVRVYRVSYDQSLFEGVQIK